MIARDGIWARRWAVVKHFIKVKEGVEEQSREKRNKTYTITLTETDHGAEVNVREKNT